MKYTLIKDGERVASSNDFDSLVNLADRDCGGFVVETKDYDAQQREIEAMRVHMQRGGIVLTGNNLNKILSRGLVLTDEEFAYLVSNTFIDGEYGSEIDEFSAAVNETLLSKIATRNQLPLLCKTCRNAKARKDTAMPPHFASSGCESGKRNHCTCDRCY